MCNEIFDFNSERSENLQLLGKFHIPEPTRRHFQTFKFNGSPAGWHLAIIQSDRFCKQTRWKMAGIDKPAARNHTLQWAPLIINIPLCVTPSDIKSFHKVIKKLSRPLLPPFPSPLLIPSAADLRKNFPIYPSEYAAAARARSNQNFTAWFQRSPPTPGPPSLVWEPWSFGSRQGWEIEINKA